MGSGRGFRWGLEITADALQVVEGGSLTAVLIQGLDQAGGHHGSPFEHGLLVVIVLLGAAIDPIAQDGAKDGGIGQQDWIELVAAKGGPTRGEAFDQGFDLSEQVIGDLDLKSQLADLLDQDPVEVRVPLRGSRGRW